MQLPKSFTTNNSSGFQLPSIHSSIPSGYIAYSSGITGELALANVLHEIGVINPNEIKEEASLPSELIIDGIQSWLEKRSSCFNRLYFHCSIQNADVINKFFENIEGIFDMPFPPGLVFCIHVDDYNGSYFYKQKASLLSNAYPGLFTTILADINAASRASLEILLSNHLVDEFCYNKYGMDYSEAIDPDNSIALMKELKERFEDDIPESFLPQNALPFFGMNFDPLLKEPFSTTKLQNLLRSENNQYIKDVLKSIIDLRKSLSFASKNKAFFSDIGFGKTSPSVFKACNLLYCSDDLVIDTIDSQISNCWNSSENAEYLTIAAFPTDEKSLKEFFFKLDLGFEVLQKLDCLIELISET